MATEAIYLWLLSNPTRKTLRESKPFKHKNSDVIYLHRHSSSMSSDKSERAPLVIQMRGPELHENIHTHKKSYCPEQRPWQINNATLCQSNAKLNSTRTCLTQCKSKNKSTLIITSNSISRQANLHNYASINQASTLHESQTKSHDIRVSNLISRGPTNSFYRVPNLTPKMTPKPPQNRTTKKTGAYYLYY